MIREAIETERKSRNWSKKKLADMSGVDRPLLVNFLNRKRSMTSANLDKICNALKLQLKK